MAAVAAAGADERGWFAVPPPVRELFKLFPLRVYAADPLPARAPDRTRERPRLYVFAREEEAQRGRPSYNPSCLKWQTYLRIAGVDVDLVPSSNHASPSGSLPFLLPSSADLRPAVPLTGGKIACYAQDRSSQDLHDMSSPRLEAYLALLTRNLRPAWSQVQAANPLQLHALYIFPANTPLLTTLYLPSNILLRTPLLHTLRTAATAEILKTTRRPLLSPPQPLADADAAFRSLAALLADDEWFFAADAPGTFDAEVFAYTHLILDKGMGWRDDSLRRCLAAFPNLVRHSTRLYERCWGAAETEV
ncbi:hypothetical protein TOPH_03621 [Tolypocladium ophioglossoides CBS 100239]|uniref:Metaxin-1 n=1 Tax=Tolypocladium ophioglossoides (strain CBS 100239) TaxID=1163406 RepID=A0A0L0NC77_TOLOC|nr:hypothetical protein TOPH_03621 [Tolypocladium ophioglossoides CBS 100239]